MNKKKKDLDSTEESVPLTSKGRGAQQCIRVCCVQTYVKSQWLVARYMHTGEKGGGKGGNSSVISAEAYSATLLVMLTLSPPCCCIQARFLGLETKIIFFSL